MFEIISNLGRWTQLTANLILFGSCFFLAISWQKNQVLQAPSSWLLQLERSFPWLAGLVVIGLVVVLASTTVEATGDTANALNPDAWYNFVLQTQVGFILFIRLLLAVILWIVTVWLLLKNRSHRRYIICAFVASLPLMVGTLISHSSADEMSFAAIVPFALHVLLAGIWFGALPVFLLIVVNGDRHFDSVTRILNAKYLDKFSVIALPVMLLLIITGLIVTDRMVEDAYHTLVSSPYGWLLILKLTILAIILMIAYQVRYTWLPLFSQIDISNRIKTGVNHLRKSVRIELILALILMFVATLLANTLPAKHTEIEHWPFPFRFIYDFEADDVIGETQFWVGMVLLFSALSAVFIGTRLNWSWQGKWLAPGIAVIGALAITLPPVTIEAYPETYQKPLVALDALSISQGSHLFAEHCAQCHGPQGKGSGALAHTLSSDPTDLLTEPHTARHTVGNFYYWIAHGVTGTDMPGFSDIMDEEDIWDVVNFLHALSRGFDARLLGTMILPNTPAIGAPVFFYSTDHQTSGDLKDFRFKQNVILVFFSWPQSKDRLMQLKHVYERIADNHHTEMLAVPLHALSDQALQTVTDIIPFPIVTEGWSEIADTYRLYRRVRTVPDLSGVGLSPVHIEYMIDRFGYLRARWNAQFEGFGWQNINVLTQQLDMLNDEEEIMPPPDEHAH